MIEILAAVSLVLSVIACAGVAMLILKREDLTNVESKLRTLSLEVADVVDRLQVWQRRDAARVGRVARAAADVGSGSEPDQHVAGDLSAGKDRLRQVARSRGMIR